MSTLQVTNIITANGTTDLVLKTGNTTGPQIVIAANGESITLRGNSVSNSVFINTSSVFINGSIPSSNIASLTATGSVVISGNVTPTIITSNTSAWNPGTSNVYVIRLQANAAGTASNTAIYEAYISGLTAGTNGQVLVLSNIGGQKIQLRNEDSANETTASNRFSLPNHVWLGGFQSLKIIYDGTLARWRPMNSLLFAQNYKSQLTKGFFAGGESPAAKTSQVTKITYSSDTSALVSGTLSQARGFIAGAGNADKGFFVGGGATAGNANTADKVVFSSDSVSAAPSANLTIAINCLTGLGNADKGFFLRNSSSQKTTYSTEATVALSGTLLSIDKNICSAVGNIDKGFVAGGQNLSAPGFPATALTDRVIYSTETTAAVSGANLSQARYGVSGIGNVDKGFCCGGLQTTPTAATLTTTDRIRYSTETTAAVSGANLSQARTYTGAAGNDDKGFCVGGTTTTSGPYVSTSDAVNYTSETTAVRASAALSDAICTLAGI